jgi:hypothetical protein
VLYVYQIKEELKENYTTQLFIYLQSTSNQPIYSYTGITFSITKFKNNNFYIYFYIKIFKAIGIMFLILYNTFLKLLNISKL